MTKSVGKRGRRLAGGPGCGTLHSVSRPPVTVVGIGADGWPGLADPAATRCTPPR